MDNVTFLLEEVETADMCDEVIAGLLVLPMERFYQGEAVMLGAVIAGYYVKDQAVLDWLFDLRRMTAGDRFLEGNVIYRYGDDGKMEHRCGTRRAVVLPRMVCHR